MLLFRAKVAALCAPAIVNICFTILQVLRGYSVCGEYSGLLNKNNGERCGRSG